MPIYEYACETCSTNFEKLMKMSAPTPSCPECGSEEVKKKVSASGFVLKGSGWYRDHYGLKSSGSSGDSSAGSASESTPSPSTSSDKTD